MQSKYPQQFEQFIREKQYVTNVTRPFRKVSVVVHQMWERTQECLSNAGIPPRCSRAPTAPQLSLLLRIKHNSHR